MPVAPDAESRRSLVVRCGAALPGTCSAVEKGQDNRRPLSPVIAASLLYLAIVGLGFVVRFDRNVLLGDAVLLIATLAAWLFSRWYQRRYPADE